MLFTNIDKDSRLLKELDYNISHATNITIATGYSSLSTVRNYKQTFIDKTISGGNVQLLLGMAFYQGIRKDFTSELTNLSLQLNTISPSSGVYLSTNNPYHGKIYKFGFQDEEKIYIGSSNFSPSGLIENHEATLLLDKNQHSYSIEYLNYLFSSQHSTLIQDTEIPVRNAKNQPPPVGSFLQKLPRHHLQTASLPNHGAIHIDLAEKADKMKSNLNAYFGKGRWSKTTGKIKPRNWYEVEIIVPTTITRQENYPKGKFTAYTDDGYIIPMGTNGDYYKNLRSSLPRKDGGLKVLGEWIKTKLQTSGALEILTPVTTDTFILYGNKYLTLQKIEENKYYMKF